MKTFIADIIPRIQQYSQRLDNLTMLSNQHWVVLDELKEKKTVYIFRQNGELIIAVNGKVEKAKWEFLGLNYILIDLKESSYLFKHGFFDKNILALKIDSKEEYAILVNENKFEGELNSITNVLDFLKNKYLVNPSVTNQLGISKGFNIRWLNTDKGMVEIRTKLSSGYTFGDLVYLDNELAQEGKYILSSPSWLGNYIIVKNGKLEEI